MNENLFSLMIEVNRKLYLGKGKDNAVCRGPSFDRVRSQIYEVEKRIALYMKRMCAEEEKRNHEMPAVQVRNTLLMMIMCARLFVTLTEDRQFLLSSSAGFV